jgi:hypothetical protein
MAQAVRRRPLTAETRVRARVNPCGMRGRQSGTDKGLSPSSSVFPCQYHSTVALQLITTWGMNSRPVGGRSSETSSHHIAMYNNPMT